MVPRYIMVPRINYNTSKVVTNHVPNSYRTMEI